ncbi:hypothetical protein BU16DRAFT_619417 [Lophium mytilinum]|uniref:Uncharacterized protein n=1 Tax=Lophium mytilinum TaxID=390894 RepID=A0A6A6QQ46_9PEZI|nr:hypothetical protein BU16DRAFT_619417 [Lophium mytilinum]
MIGADEAPLKHPGYPNMATSSSISPTGLVGLPLELRTMIARQLEQVNSAADNPNITTGYELCKWSRLTQSSRNDILSYRAAARDLRDASWISFGRLVGELCFRLIEPDLQDLEEISNLKELAPWIQAITFGTAGFADNKFVWRPNNDEEPPYDELNNYDDSFDDLPGLTDDYPELLKYMHRTRNEPALLRLEKYRDCYKKQETFSESGLAVKQLEKILHVFPNLQNLRVTPKDYIGIKHYHDSSHPEGFMCHRCTLVSTSEKPHTEGYICHRCTLPTSGMHLRGWLTADERLLFAEDWEKYVAVEGHNHLFEYKPEIEKRKQQFTVYNSNRSKEVLPIIFTAWARSDKSLADFRVAEFHGASPPTALLLSQHLSEKLTNLHTLRLNMFTGPQFDADTGALSAILKTTPSLRDLQVDLVMNELEEDLSVFEIQSYELSTGKVLMNTINTGMTLSRLHVSGSWFEARELASLLQFHSQSLQFVVLEIVTICGGTWESLLRCITTSTYPKLQYLGLSNVFEQQEDLPRGEPLDVTDIDEAIFKGATFCFEANATLYKTDEEFVRFGRDVDDVSGL